jgi:hypothetical protein
MPRETEAYFKTKDSRDDLRVVTSPEFGLVKIEMPGQGEVTMDAIEAERLGAALLKVEPVGGFEGTYRRSRP